MPTMTTGGVEHCQSRRDNRSRGHCHPRDANISPNAALLLHAFAGSVASRREVCTLYCTWEYIENLAGSHGVLATMVDNWSGKPFCVSS